ncbi:MAG: alanine--tRNA ligase [Patescibacteria group bacterium]
MTRMQLIEKYFRFFGDRGHQEIPNASLIPREDPSVLFTTAGMHPLVPYLLGAKHPQGQRLYNNQKCIRTSDIELVGDPVHLTFFEMLGNWSLGDYWKEEMIAWSFEFLTKELGLDKRKLWVSYFGGQGDIPEDKETRDIWRKLLEHAHVIPLGQKDNFWGPVGQSGPCGPDTEMFYDTGQVKCGTTCGPHSNFTCDCGKYVEIWNDVFMEYNKTKDGKYEKLKQRNIDTGMGVERTLMVLNRLDNVYETETLKPLMDLINTDDQKSARIIVDHLRAATFILGEGIEPSNLEQGYVLRRLIRSAIRRIKIVGREPETLFSLVEKTLFTLNDYDQLVQKKDFVLNELQKEHDNFLKSLEKGLKMFDKELSAFELYTTYGFPLEMTQELRKERGIPLADENEFWTEMKKHQELSRSGAANKFKGGLVNQSDKAKKLHTATHLLQAALKKVLGDHVEQKGSNITAERLRFDFSHPNKMTREQISKVENIVNEQIKKALPVGMNEMTVEKAKEIGAIGIFEDKYADKVKVYKVGDFSCEICGGPHVANTSELGNFKVKKEESSSAGIRRIKAVLQ